MADFKGRLVGPWEIGQKIGSGSFAVVWKGRHKETGEEVAIKEISTDSLSKKLQRSLESEVSILKRITHRNIVHLRDVLEVRCCTEVKLWGSFGLFFYFQELERLERLW